LRFFPVAVTSGEGSWMIEAGGRRLLDLSSTWTAAGLGHGHPKVVEAVTEAIKHPAGAGGLSAVHPHSVGLAEDLLELVPGEGDRRVYLGHAGSDANDVAIRAARHATGRPRVLAFHHSYHGGVGVAMGMSGVHVDAGAVVPDANSVFVDYPNPYRPEPADRSADQVAAASVAAVEKEISAGDVACVLAEPILSDGGMVVPPPGFLAGLTEVCRRHDTLLLCDEVKVGLGRPGLLHAFQLDGAQPDIVTFGKVLGAGLPMSAAVGPAWVLDGPPAAALLTTAGNPVCSAVGRVVLRTLVDDDLPQRAHRAGERLMSGMRDLDLPQVGDIRGHGLAIGVELVTERGSKEPARALAAKTVFRAFELGAVVYYVGGNVLEVTPPLVITDDEVDRAIELLGQSITDAAAGKVSDQAVAAYAGW
ncbi:MAG TPA: aminotransferase class III-fold pyridoxal phosphate-dependent enzyme, partial [Mycobacteriales bacterium]|nr:aminotransferase class III-fold pyridoxal phosphate-dependent enzyme [Mycobacteriales bacterium]